MILLHSELIFRVLLRTQHCQRFNNPSFKRIFCWYIQKCDFLADKVFLDRKKGCVPRIYPLKNPFAQEWYVPQKCSTHRQKAETFSFICYFVRFSRILPIYCVIVNVLNLLPSRKHKKTAKSAISSRMWSAVLWQFQPINMLKFVPNL